MTPHEQHPVAWGYRDRHGNIIDVITPAEHARAQGSYTIPLYTAPPRTWQHLPEDTLEELLGLHCDTSGNMSEADAREFAKDLGSRLKELNA